MRYLSLSIFFLCCLPLLSIAQNSSETTLEIPNVFTPNGDKINDVFKINSDSLITLKMTFFNRWGMKIAELQGINNHWDGRATSGEEVPQGIYMYIIEGEDKSAVKFKKTGNVSLLR